MFDQVQGYSESEVETDTADHELETDAATLKLEMDAAALELGTDVVVLDLEIGTDMAHKISPQERYPDE
jgi:hypothetical protein